MYKVIDFKKYSSIGIGAKHKVKIIEDIDDYSNYQIIGKANNILVSTHLKKPIALLGKNFDYIEQKNDKLIVGASTTSASLLNYCKKNNIAYFELLTKLPGSIGGLVKMNAGLKEWEIFNNIYSVKTKSGIILKKDIIYGYRHTNINEIIYEIVFNITKGYSKQQQNIFIKMRNNQPSQASAGSCFKNPKEYSAGYLIEDVGLKGYSIGGMQFSFAHANFLVNKGNGTYDEAIELIRTAQNMVREKYNINMELEIQII